MTIKEMKAIHIEKALAKYETNTKAAKALGITARTIDNYKKLKDGKKTLGT